MVVRFDCRSLFVPYLAVGFLVVDGRGSREFVWPLRLRQGTNVLTVRQYMTVMAVIRALRVAHAVSPPVPGIRYNRCARSECRGSCLRVGLQGQV